MRTAAKIKSLFAPGRVIMENETMRDGARDHDRLNLAKRKWS